MFEGEPVNLVKLVKLDPSRGDKIWQVISDGASRTIVDYQQNKSRTVVSIGLTEEDGIIFRDQSENGEIWTIVGGKIIKKSGTVKLTVSGARDQEEKLLWESIEFTIHLPSSENGSGRWSVPLKGPSWVARIEKSVKEGYLIKDCSSGPYPTLMLRELYIESLDTKGLSSSDGTKELLPPYCPFENTMALQAMPRQFRTDTSKEDIIILPLMVGYRLLNPVNKLS